MRKRKNKQSTGDKNKHRENTQANNSCSSKIEKKNWEIICIHIEDSQIGPFLFSIVFVYLS